MAQQVPVTPDAVDKGTKEGRAHEVLPDLAFLTTAIVNVILVGQRDAGDRAWVLVDAGVIGSAGAIREAARDRFGGTGRPAAIVMTHGHFDHVGVLETLAAEWDVPVYAHQLERPYLDGTAAYPPGDPSVGGGLMSLLSPLYPTKPVDVGSRLQTLPPDGTVPVMSGWRWLHTPGHSPGHISLWREADRTLIAGDAVVTTAQESAYAVATQEPELHGPPMYFTIEWDKAERSARLLADLQPDLLVTGHGLPMQGEPMRAALHRLAQEFRSVAVPAKGRYVNEPARAEDGSAYREP